jgi:hypothetical protein
MNGFAEKEPNGKISHDSHPRLYSALPSGRFDYWLLSEKNPSFLTMTARNYFNKRFLNTNLSFQYPEPSEWRIVSKIYEIYSQVTKDEAENDGENSYAEGKFLCENKEDPNQHAHMRVYMQIANQGTEFEPIEERAKQAADRTVDTIHEEIQVLKLLTEKKSQHTPTLLGYKEEKQDNSGLVPGGYVCYLLWN